ncbi:PSP1 domain-containing protein [Desulfovibrio gilichinskyi]|uniref:Cell fate regulator YaaT, PSP1 superfamily (Controls sporulation, competence, biofilm development) n=1 Tax=Desulfovibrio gilichinskyi TaxID=1519643 RepID=A0A1X7CJJ0_9BACT|nr:regulatory iron-sulfur-containing complex subunit RicT [Desulfovibrio gilichinskyi]SME97800.1 Cell fate regulator YaaT, PSP1 superfamily (controls sporulation, competence, biofilm development) [Desulfovibrio gilichinskyi]
MSQILGVKFNDFGQIYYFSSGPFVVREGHSVIVKTEQGMGLGKVFVVQQDLPEDVTEESVKTIYRLAAEEDLVIDAENRDLSRNALRYCKGCIDGQKLEMKLVDVEVFFDRSKMIFYFTAPGRIDFRELVKDLVKEYRTRIELRQIGVRHETQMLGAIGNCGQICCCRRFMRKFMPVTIRMAKEQNLFLNPTKISGICGRLLCCLSFEQDNYEQFHKRCPKIGKRYTTAHGNVKVTRTNFFSNTVTIQPDDAEEIEICLDEWPDVLKATSPDQLVKKELPKEDLEFGNREPSVRNNYSGRSGSVKAADAGQTSRPERPKPVRPERPRPEKKKRPFVSCDSLELLEDIEPEEVFSEPVEAPESESQAKKPSSRNRRPSRRRRRKKSSGGSD